MSIEDRVKSDLEGLRKIRSKEERDQLVETLNKLHDSDPQYYNAFMKAVDNKEVMNGWVIEAANESRRQMAEAAKKREIEAAKQREAEAQNRTDRGKLYETVDKDLRALKTPEEKKAFATRLEVYSRQKGYSHEYYKAAVVLVASKEYPEDVENLVREADKKAKEKAVKANEGSEGKGGNEGSTGGGRSGGAGSRAGGNGGSTGNGNLTISANMDYALKMGPTVLKEKMEEMGITFDAGMIRHAANGNEYIPTSKLRKFMQEHEFTADQIKILNDLVDDRAAFKAKVKEINERDQYIPTTRSGRGGRGSAGGNNGNDEAPEPVKVEEKKAPTRGEMAAASMAAMGMPVNENTAKLLDEEFARQEAAKAAKEAAEKARQEQIAQYKKLYAEKPDEFAKQKEAAEKDGKKDQLAMMNEAEAAVKAEVRKQKFASFKKLLEEHPDKFESTKKTAQQNLDIPEAKENLKLMEDVEKYVKLEKQMQKDLKKAKDKEEKARKAYGKGKTEKGKKYDDKAKELRAEAGKLSEQMRELNPGEKQAAEPISAARAKELSEVMKKDKGKSKESLGNRILSAVGLKKNREQGQQTAAQVLSAEAPTQTATAQTRAAETQTSMAEKKVVREVNGNVTKYTISGIYGEELSSANLCNGTYIVTKGQDGKTDTIQFTDGGDAPVITFEYKNEKEKAQTVQNLNNAFIKYNPEVAIAMQKGKERG